MNDRAQNPEEPRTKTGAEEPAAELYIRHVEDRGLSATVILPKLSEDRRPQGPVPIFVP
jgi:hypothetical protein